MCLYPKLIKNPKYKANKKNGGIIPPITDERVKYVPVGCQRCIECRKQKSNGWRVRLLEDIKTNTNGKFITLTFSNESIKKIINYINNKNIQGYELDNQIATTAIRLFLERWRKTYKKSLRHWLVTELGHNGTENIHLHGIIWTNETIESIRKHWQYGFVWPTKDSGHTWVNAKTVNYIVKYIHKIDEKHKYYQSRVLTSAGIGSNYTKNGNVQKNIFNGEKTNETYKTQEGYKIAMPIYWRNKIYTETEREKLWLQRLDKNEIWIRGEKVAANDIETINKLREWHREINKQLGYGNDEKNWNQIQYENERRNMLNAKRVLASGRE